MNMDDRTTLRDLSDLVCSFRDAREWAQFHHPKDLALALGIEAGELGELFLWKRNEEVDAALQDPAFRERVAGELADIQVFLLFLADRVQIPLAEAVRDKMERNEGRYPVALARGSARKHDEL